MKFRSKLNHGFTNRGCLHCAILTLYCFKKERARAQKARDMEFLLQNVEHFQVYENNQKQDEIH